MSQLILPYIYKNIRAAAVLTNSFVAATVLDNETCRTLDSNQLVLYVNFTLGSLTNAQIKIEFSNGDSNWYQETSSSISAGVDSVSPLVHQLTSTGLYRIPVKFQDKQIRVSAVGTGTVTGSSMQIDAIVGYN